MAAIVMIFEMTLDYTVVVPMTLTVAISYGVRRSLILDSIYTRKLTLRGESVPETMRADVQQSRRASSLMHPVTAEALANYMVTGDGPSKQYIVVPEDASLWEVIAKMRSHDVSVALVASKHGTFDTAHLQGLITQKDILDALADDLELF